MVASPTVEPEGPGPYLLDAEDLARDPGILTEDRPQLLLIRRLDREQSDIVAAVAADRPAEDDDASLNERIEEPRMLVPGWLLTDPQSWSQFGPFAVVTANVAIVHFLTDDARIYGSERLRGVGKPALAQVWSEQHCQLGRWWWLRRLGGGGHRTG